MRRGGATGNVKYRALPVLRGCEFERGPPVERGEHQAEEKTGGRSEQRERMDAGGTVCMWKDDVCEKNARESAAYA